MAEPLHPEVMVRQVEALADDLRERTGLFDQRVRGLLTASQWGSIGTVYLTGNGDSYHASCAAEMAFATISDVPCGAVSALRFLGYDAPWMRSASPRRPLVIATSASGGTTRVVQAIEAASAHGALTIAVTGTPNSAVTRAADRALLVDLPRPERSPGIRTYQASLLGLLLVAIQLGQTREHHPGAQGDALRRELAALADAVAATTHAIKDRCHQVADMIADASVMVMAGSGPSYGTALFSAAKMIEASGVFTAGQDLEEWCHVERHAYPDDMPIFVIAPPGRSYWRAAQVAATARGLRRRVIAVTADNDTEITRHAHTVLPVHGKTREEFSPLLYHVFASYVASFLTQRLGRSLFQTDRPRRV